MTLQSEIVTSVMAGSKEGNFTLNIVVREITDDGAPYFVAECLELPGCVSEGNTPEEVQRNMENAIKECISVLFQDCLEKVVSHHPLPDLRGISSQRKVSVAAFPELQLA
jgi:predicted RNase H-like HicB family nuclease